MSCHSFIFQLFGIIFLLKVSPCLGGVPSLLYTLRKSCQKKMPRGHAKSSCFFFVVCCHRCSYFINIWYHCKAKPQEITETIGFYFAIVILNNLTEIRSLASPGNSVLIEDTVGLIPQSGVKKIQNSPTTRLIPGTFGLFSTWFWTHVFQPGGPIFFSHAQFPQIPNVTLSFGHSEMDGLIN